MRARRLVEMRAREPVEMRALSASEETLKELLDRLPEPREKAGVSQMLEAVVRLGKLIRREGLSVGVLLELHLQEFRLFVTLHHPGGDGGPTQELRRLQAAVPGDELVPLVDENRIHQTVSLEALRQGSEVTEVFAHAAPKDYGVNVNLHTLVQERIPFLLVG